jgi:Cu+-exporting ATPase
VACPCALALAVPFIYGNALRVLSNMGIFVKNDLALRKLSFINHIIFDKTGTITLDSEKNINYVGEVLSEEETAVTHAVCFQSTHPLSIRLEKLLRRKTILYPQSYNEITGKGLVAHVDGMDIKLGSSKLIEVPSNIKYDDSIVHLEINGKYKGYFLFKSNYRPFLKRQIAELQKDYYIDLISGDNDAEKIILQETFNNKGNLVFNLSPFDKVEYIKKIKRLGIKKVLMIGDGLNDSGALKESDLGIAIAANESNFTPASDIIIAADKFQDINNLLKFSKAIYKALKVALLIAVLYNIVGLAFAITGNLSPIVAAILMPASSISIVIYGIGTSYYLYDKHFKSSANLNHKSK